MTAHDTGWHSGVCFGGPQDGMDLSSYGLVVDFPHVEEVEIQTEYDDALIRQYKVDRYLWDGKAWISQGETSR